MSHKDAEEALGRDKSLVCYVLGMRTVSQNINKLKLKPGSSSRLLMESGWMGINFFLKLHLTGWFSVLNSGIKFGSL